MRDYFIKELSLLKRELEKYSTIDNATKQLLTSVAGFTSQIQRRIDDDIPELCESLLQHCFPQVLLPYPARTIVEFRPKHEQLHGAYSIAANTRLRSRSVGDEKTCCEFRTLSAVTVNPLAVAAADFLVDHKGNKIFQLRLQTINNTPLKKLDLRDLSCYLHAEFNFAVQLYFALLYEVNEIRVNGVTARVTISAAFPEFDRSQGFAEFGLLQDYFLFKKQFMFVKFLGLEHIKSDDNKLDIDILVADSCELAFKMDCDVLRLNCVVAENIFPLSSEPLQIDDKSFLYKFVPCIARQSSVLLYDIDKVIAFDSVSGCKNVYTRLNFCSSVEREKCFQVKRYRVATDCEEVYLMFNSAVETSISCEITAHNGHYPQQLSDIEQLYAVIVSLPDFIEGFTLIKPSKLFLHPITANYRWQLLAQLSLNYQALNDAIRLRELLSLYDWSGDNLQRICGIKNIVVKDFNHLRQGVLLNCLQFELSIDEYCYLSIADIYLFGSVLHKFFSMYVAINNLTFTKIICQPSLRVLVWDPIVGKNMLS